MRRLIARWQTRRSVLLQRLAEHERRHAELDAVMRQQEAAMTICDNGHVEIEFERRLGCPLCRVLLRLNVIQRAASVGRDGSLPPLNMLRLFEHIVESCTAPDLHALPPLPVVIFCPNCRTQHIDAPAPERDWDNPPHRSHECTACGFTFRVADVPTEGVKEITTRGQHDGEFRAQYEFIQEP